MVEAAKPKAAMSSKPQHCVEVVPRIADIPAAVWDACANPDPAVRNPFIAHAFLKALEDAGTVGGRSGWTPRHLVLKEATGSIVGCAPCYVKSHSQGEYVFDRSWADAYERAGGRYYPKLQIAVPLRRYRDGDCWWGSTPTRKPARPCSPRRPSSSSKAMTFRGYTSPLPAKASGSGWAG